MLDEHKTKWLAYEQALRTLPELSDAIISVFRKAMDENLSFEQAAKAIGTDDAVQAAAHLRRIQTYSNLLPSYYEELIEKVYTNCCLDNNNEDYMNE